MPVRFSVTFVVILPSADSFAPNDGPMRLKCTAVYASITGTHTTDASAMRQSSAAMIGSGITSISTARPISGAWFARNARIVSMSELQRWITSPEGSSSSVPTGSRCTWSYMRSRMRRATRSAAPVASRALMCTATPAATEIATIASAGIHSASRTRSAPPIQPTIVCESDEAFALSPSTTLNTLCGTSGAM